MNSESSHEFQEYRGDGINSDKTRMTNPSGDWKVFYFWQQFVEHQENIEKCPKTYEILKRLKNQGLLLAGMVCFSSLMPGTHIVAHTGPSNMRLTCHLGLIGCEGNEVIVGGVKSEYVDGKCTIFDDSYVHEVVSFFFLNFWIFSGINYLLKKVTHRGNHRRVSLMLDFWHPDLNQTEIDAFSTVMANSSSFMHPDEFFHSLKLNSIF